MGHNYTRHTKGMYKIDDDPIQVTRRVSPEESRDILAAGIREFRAMIQSAEDKYRRIRKKG